MNNTSKAARQLLQSLPNGDALEAEALRMDPKQTRLYKRTVRRIASWHNAYTHKEVPLEAVYWNEREFRVWAGVAAPLAPEGAQREEEELDARPSLLACPKCHQHRVDHFTKQTRSADEPETIFAHCLACGHRWRQNG